MQLKGKVKDICKDLITSKWVVSFLVDECNLHEFNALVDKDLSIEAKPYREKRSLNANACLWVLCSRIAEAIRSTKEDVYLKQLFEHPFLYPDGYGQKPITLSAEIPYSGLPQLQHGHWFPYQSDGKWTAYIIIKGSSDFDTKEMSILIDSVIEEAKELGLETLPPNEIAKLKELWKGA